MVAKPRPKSDCQGIFGGLYQLKINNIEITINTTVEGPQRGTNTAIRADFVD